MVLVSAALAGVLAFVGALVGHVVTRKGARELDRWRHREETMRLLRWAVELAASDEPARSSAGAASLTALLDSPLLDAEDISFVLAIASDIALVLDSMPEVEADD